MLIRALKTMACPTFAARAGDPLDVPAPLARQLIAADAAEQIGPDEVADIEAVPVVKAESTDEAPATKKPAAKK